MAFDYPAAKDEGYTDEEIVKHLAEQQSFDMAGAQAEGYTTSEMLHHLLPSAAPATSPPEKQPFFPKVKQFITAYAREIKQHKLEPFGAILKSFGPQGDEQLYHYIKTHGYDQNMVDLGDPQAAQQKTITDNMKDIAFAGLDVATLGAGSSVTSSVGQVALKAGLKPALATISGVSMESAGYLGIHDGIDAAIRGESARGIAEEAAKGAGTGAAVGAALGGAGLGLQRIAKVLARGRIESMTAQRAGQAGEAATAELEKTQQDILRELKLMEFPDKITERTIKQKAREILAGKPREEALQDLLRGQSGRSATEVKAAAAARRPTDDALAQEFDQFLARDPAAFEPVTVAQRAAHAPYAGSESLRPFVRATAGEVKTVREHIQDASTTIRSAFSHEPGATDEVQNLFLNGRRVIGTARDRSHQTIAHRVMALFEGDAHTVGQKTAALSDYMSGINRLATIRSIAAKAGTPAVGPKGTTAADWEAEVSKLARPVLSQPDVLAAYRSVRNIFDEMFQVMVERGMIAEERYRADYVPMERIYSIATALRDQTAGTEVGRQLSSVLKRNSAGDYVETNIVRLLEHSLTAFNRKVAEDDFWQALITNPDINVTRLFTEYVGEPLPKGFAAIRPKPGMPGFRMTSGGVDPFEDVTLAMQDASEFLKDRYTHGSFVFPKDVAKRLEHFYQRTNNPVERMIYAGNHRFARFLTVYNLGNTELNKFSDFVVALKGLPGEKAHTAAFLRMFPKAVKAAYRGAFGADDPLYRRAVREGVAGSTFIRSIGGELIPPELEPGLSQGSKALHGPLRHAGDTLIRYRQAVEAAPRIAGGLAAEAKSGNPADFARVGEQITLPYGAGDPALTRAPIMRLLAPFWKWSGMATNREIQLLAKRGSRARAIAWLTGPAVAAATWNIHNDEFKKVEYSLNDYERNHMHIILSDPQGKVLRHKDGSPFVWRMRWNVSEEVLSIFGLGNIPGRAYDMAKGLTTPGEFLGETASEAAQNVVSLPAGITAAIQTIGGKSSLTGQEMENYQRLERTIPLAYQLSAAIQGIRDEGVVPGTLQAIGRIYGIRKTGVKKGRLNAKVAKLAREIRDAKMRMHSARARGKRTEMEYFQRKLQRLSDRQRKLHRALADLYSSTNDANVIPKEQ